MSVLESFYFQFAADSSKLKAGLAEGDKGSKDLEKSLQNTDSTASKLGGSLEKLAATAGKALAALFALHELKKLTQETTDHTYAVAQQARALDMSTESLSAWQQSVKMSGGTAEGATQSIKGLRDKFVEMSRFGGMMGPEAFMFEQLGLSAKDMHDSIKDPMITMGKLADTFGKLDRTQSLFLGQKLGLDQGTINLLMQGRRGLEEMIAKQKELGIVTEAQAEAATKFKLKTVELGIVFETSARQLTGALLPALTWLLDKVEKVMVFLGEHRAAAAAFFTTIAAVVTAAYLPAIVSAAVATFALLAPFLLIGVAVAAVAAAIALVVDDIASFIEGGDSLIGRAVNKWPILGQVFKAIGEIIHMSVQLIKTALKAMVTAIMETASLLKPIIEAMAWPWKVFEMVISKVFALFGKAPVALLNLIGKGLAQASGGHYDEIGAPDAETAAKAAQKAVSRVTPSGVPVDVVAAARASEAKYGIPAEVTMAQWKLESNSGKNMPTGSNNPFGIKARAGQDYVEAMTNEVINGQSVRVMQKFAKFDSLSDAFDAHAKLLATGGAYKNARTHSDDPLAFADALTGKYATDPAYGSKLKAIIAGQGAGVGLAQAGLLATNTPLNGMNSQSIANSVASRSTNISMGPIAVHTQATSGEDVTKAIGDGLHGHMKNALEAYDDGISA